MDFSDLDLPIPTHIADRGIGRLSKNNFKQIAEVFNSLFVHTQSMNPEFD